MESRGFRLLPALQTSAQQHVRVSRCNYRAGRFVVWWIEASQVGHLLYHVEVNAISLLSGVDKSTHIKDFVQGVGAVSRVALYTEAAQATITGGRVDGFT